MSAGSLGKEGGGAAHDGNEPSGPHRVLAGRPDTDTDRLIDGGRRGTGHAAVSYTHLRAHETSAHL
eukprot:27926-Alexandrium_andersonii.AAC.1